MATFVVDEKSSLTSISTSPGGELSAKEEPGYVQLHLKKERPGDVTIEMETKDAELIQFLSLEKLAEKLETNVTLLGDIRNSEGLKESDAKIRLERDGQNVLTPPPEKSALRKYIVENLGHPLMLLLIVAGILSFIAYGLAPQFIVNLYSAIVLFVAVFVSSIFSFIQEGRASNAMKAFRSMLPRYANVIRDRKIQRISAAELVKGDLVSVRGGDQVPADLRVLWTNECRVELSSLTGESLPITCTLTTDAPRLEDAHNLLFNTSRCVEGEALGVVFATGDQTLIGKIAHLASDTTTVLTPIQKETSVFVRNLSGFAAILGIIFFIIGMSQGQPFIATFINSFILVLVAVVPQGLPLTVVSCLAITARRLAEKQVFVKELRSVETLGSTTVIASDKTGTLTQNKMVLSRLWLGGMALTEESLRDIPRNEGSISLLSKSRSSSTKSTKLNPVAMLELAAGVCNRARYEDEKRLTASEAMELEVMETLYSLDPQLSLRDARTRHPLYLENLERGMSTYSLSTVIQKYQTVAKIEENKNNSQRKVIGEPTEIALFNFIQRRSNVELLRYHWPVIFEQAFNSRNKYALTIVKPNHVEGYGACRKLLIKGAPEVILGKCSHHINNGQIEKMDEDFTSMTIRACETFANAGERVLGFAFLDLDNDQYGSDMDNKYTLEPPNFPQDGYVFIGLTSLVDPPKATVPDAIATCRQAGIRVFMVTGDHPLTATAIARQIGIITNPTRDELARLRQCPVEEIPWEEVKAIVLHGGQLESFTEPEWDRVLKVPEIVFARTTPSQKLEIVTQLQRVGEVVAVTGDGVNDAPALKKGDIGLAMGISGSDCSRDAADVVLMNDDFSSIVDGIRLGRTIFDNLKKTIAYTLTHLVPEVVPALLNLAFGFPLGMSPLMVLCIDLGTELAPAVSLAYEPPEQNVMLRAPRNSKTDRLVDWQVVRYVLFHGGLIETSMAFFAFAMVFIYYGLNPSTLFFSTAYFSLGSPNLYSTIDGHAITDVDQMNILMMAQTAFWVMVPGSQVFHVFMCKTRFVSIVEHGWSNNIVLLYGIVVEICLMVLIVFVPSSHMIFSSNDFPGRFWPILFLSWFLFFTTVEGFKLLKRNYPNNKFIQKLLF